MTNTPLTAYEIDEILGAVHEELEAGASADRIKEIADENPQARTEILAFTAEWVASPGSDLTDDMPPTYEVHK